MIVSANIYPKGFRYQIRLVLSRGNTMKKVLPDCKYVNQLRKNDILSFHYRRNNSNVTLASSKSDKEQRFRLEQAQCTFVDKHHGQS